MDATAAAERFSIDLPDGTLAGWRWRNEGAPRIAFCHATGFCAAPYKSMLSLLAPDFELFAFDQRGHGRTKLPADPARLRNWIGYARDLGAAIDALGGGRWILAGHSCGAVVSALAARGRTDVSAILMIEPASLRPIAYGLARTPFWSMYAGKIGLVRAAAARRAEWPDRETARAGYTRKEFFAGWAPGVLDDYLEDGLTRTSEGVRLACAPAWEAATFAAHAHDLWGAVRDAPAPVEVLAADHRSSTVPPARRADYVRRGAQVRLAAGVSHLIPLENPALAAEFVADAARRAQTL